EPAAERVPDPVGLLDAERLDGLEQVVGMRREAPGRLVARAPVAAQVGRDDAERRPALLRQMLEALAVRGHAVQADERPGPRVAPLVHVQQHRARENTQAWSSTSTRATSRLSRPTPSRMPRTITSGWAPASRARSSGPAATRSSVRRWRSA